MTFIRPNLGPQLSTRFQKPVGNEEGNEVTLGNNGNNNAGNVDNNPPLVEVPRDRDSILALKGITIISSNEDVQLSNSVFGFHSRAEFEEYRDKVGFKPGDEISIYNEETGLWDQYMVNTKGNIMKVVGEDDPQTHDACIFYDTFEELQKAIDAGVIKEGDLIYVKHQSKERTYFVVQLNCDENGKATSFTTSLGVTVETKW